MKLLKVVSKAVIMLIVGAVVVHGKATTGVAIFNYSVGTRQLGMADVAAGIADDANAIYYNPAGLAQVRNLELNAMYFDNIVDTKDEAVNLVVPLQRGIFGKRASIGFGLKAYQGGDIEVIMLDPNNSASILSQKTMSAENDYMASLGYAEMVSKSLYIGLAFKGIHSTLVEDYTASAVALDAGLLYQTPLKGLNIGLSALNNGTEMKFIEEGDVLPMRTVAGIGYTMQPMKSVGVTLGCDYITEKNADDQINVGAEFRLLNMVSLRSGYYTSSDLGSITGGVGIKLGMFQIDYGYGLMDELGDLHRASITMRWDTGNDEVAEKPVRRTQKVVRKKSTDKTPAVKNGTMKKVKRVVKKKSAANKKAVKKYNLDK